MLLSHLDKPEGFVHPDAPDYPADIGRIAHANSDLAFGGGYAFVGNFQGIYDLSTPTEPALVTSSSVRAGRAI